MSSIVRLTLENAPIDRDRWDGIAHTVRAWARAEGVVLRDACLLLPFAQLLPLARDTFARAAGWMPRIETTRTLAASLGPAVIAPPGQISFDATLDALNAAALLGSQAWGAAWARRDRRGFDQAVAALVGTAHDLVRAAAAMPPPERTAYWAKARDALAPMVGPGATERLLARVALEWACLAPSPATDRLFAMAPPSAWIAVQAGGPDPLIACLMTNAAAPCLVVDTDTSPDEPFAALAARCLPAVSICDSFEHEAQCAAAQVLVHVQAGAVPVALIAQDRVLVRRVRALLEREQLSLLDETGWKLSTTRAAAHVMALLQAARTDATTDALIDWLKSGTAWAQSDGGAAISALEADCRRGPITRVSALGHAALAPAAAHLWAAASDALAELSTAKRQPLSAWLASLAAALTHSDALHTLQADDAGQQVMAALRMAPIGFPADSGLMSVSQVVMGFDEFRAWVDGVLEHATFLPGATSDEPAQVVITPLARAMLRPFAAIVFPGADDRHLGTFSPSSTLLSDAQASMLGVPTLAQRRAAETAAFAQVLAAPRVTFMRRRVDGTDPLVDSPLIERLSLALALEGRAMGVWQDPRTDLQLVPTPIRMSAPGAASLLPRQLSASSCEALRACPYRFFALNMLRLCEADEIEREIEKRDYGHWLHALLFEFHVNRGAPAASAVETARLIDLATGTRRAQGLEEAEFLPFMASFSSFAPRYVTWLHERDDDGAHWLRGEAALSLRPDGLNAIELRGRIDRIDEVREGSGAAIQLIDYKTGSAAKLKEKVKQPLEDTQLAFYAALMGAQTELPLKAMYLALDDTRRLEEIEHKGVEASAATLVEGLAHDLRRLHAGAGLPALGAGSTCEHCAARGVCRRDHWAEEATLEAP